MRPAGSVLVSDGPDTHPIPSRTAAASAGAIGAAIAMATGELLSGLLDLTPTPVLAVGGRFIDRFAASLKELAIALFGTNDKPALVIGTVITALVLGAVVGIAARRRPWLPLVVLGAFGALGASAQRLDAQDPGFAVWPVAAASALAGAASIHLLLRAATPRPEGLGPDLEAPLGSTALPSDLVLPDSPAPALAVPRRRFLGLAALLSAGAAGAAMLGRSLQQSDVVAAARQRFRLPQPGRRTPAPDQPFAVPGATPYVIPNDDFYRIDTALSTPQVDAETWRLRVTGLVDRPFELTYQELLDLPSVEEVVTLQCVSNEVGGDLVGNAVWQGVPLADLLERAGVQEAGEQLFSRSVDGWTCGFPTDLVGDGRLALVAYAMNGEPLPPAHGFPVRLVVSGLYGYVSATKWLEEIELTTWEGADGYWITRGWAKDGPIKLASRIDVPRSGAQVPAGTVTLGGIALLPATGVSAVEVAIDDGPWQEAELGRVASEHTWVQWRLRTDLGSGEHTARVRAIDATGAVQTAEEAEPAPDGATGHHQVRFAVATA
jgi:DMSO/TMAO reductase YedYZ molybdopterin-dependent catalytic subunit